MERQKKTKNKNEALPLSFLITLTLFYFFHYFELLRAALISIIPYPLPTLPTRFHVFNYVFASRQSLSFPFFRQKSSELQYKKTSPL
jgi:hypothetical protein